MPTESSIQLRHQSPNPRAVTRQVLLAHDTEAVLLIKGEVVGVGGFEIARQARGAAQPAGEDSSEDLKHRLSPLLEIRFFASPWTPPPWMKTNGRFGGGALRPECYPYYTGYFARFIEVYRREGIEIYALTVRNEPDRVPHPVRLILRGLAGEQSVEAFKAVARGPVVETRL